MSTVTKRVPPELREPGKVDHDAHANRLFEISKEARFAADPGRTAHALAQATMWLDGGSKSNVSLSPAERAQLASDLTTLEIFAFRYLSEDFTRSDIVLGFEVMHALAKRWSQEPSNRPTGDERANLADVARIWRNRLHSEVLTGDVMRRAGAAERRGNTIAHLLHVPTGADASRPN